jgi:hypothetical protein
LTSRVSGIILLGDSLGFMVLPWVVGQVLQGVGPQAMTTLVFMSLVGNLAAFAAIMRLRRTLPDRAVAANPMPKELT